MKHRVFISRLPGGTYMATCLDPQCNAKGVTEQEVLEKIRGEIQYRLEYCPCSGLRAGEFIEIEVVTKP